MSRYQMTFFRPDRTVLCRTENLGYAFQRARAEGLTDVQGTDSAGRVITGGPAYANYLRQNPHEAACETQRANLAQLQLSKP